MTMMSRLEIITTSISPSTTSMIVVSVRCVPCAASALTPTAANSVCSAVWLPKAASMRCTSSTQK